MLDRAALDAEYSCLPVPQQVIVICCRCLVVYSLLRYDHELLLAGDSDEGTILVVSADAGEGAMPFVLSTSGATRVGLGLRWATKTPGIPHDHYQLAAWRDQMLFHSVVTGVVVWASKPTATVLADLADAQNLSPHVS